MCFEEEIKQQSANASKRCKICIKKEDTFKNTWSAFSSLHYSWLLEVKSYKN